MGKRRYLYMFVPNQPTRINVKIVTIVIFCYGYNPITLWSCCITFFGVLTPLHFWKFVQIAGSIFGVLT